MTDLGAFLLWLADNGPAWRGPAIMLCAVVFLAASYFAALGLEES